MKMNFQSAVAVQLLFLLSIQVKKINGHDHEEHEKEEKKESTANSRLLLISLDGFRYDYLTFLPAYNNFSRLYRSGIWAPEGISNAFETKTFPNHYSMMTGLYEESHGLLGNSAWDPVKNVAYNLPMNSGNKNIAYLYGGEPIYVTLVKQTNSSRSVGCYMMVGCQLDLGGVHLPLSLPYNKSIPWKNRIDQVINWFVQDNIRLGLIYYDQPDTVGHASGASSLATIAVVKQLNDNIGYLLHQLEVNNLIDSINLIVTADHGMANVTDFARIDVDMDLYLIVSEDDVVWQVKPIAGKEDAAYDQLKLSVERENRADVYKKAELPDDWHYKNTPRCAPIVVVAKKGYLLVKSKGQEGRIHESTMTKLGTHGYDNRLKEMRPIFMAIGPALKRNVTTPEDFSIVDIYSLMCRVLQIQPAPNNGSSVRVEQLLSSSASGLHPLLFARNFFGSNSTSQTVFIVALCSLGSICFALLMVVTHLVRKRRGLVAGNAGYHQLARPLLGGTAKFSELNSLGADSDNSEDENVLPPEVHQHFHRGATQQTNSFVTGPTEPA